MRKGDDGALGVAPVLVEELGSVSQLEMRHDGVDIDGKVAKRVFMNLVVSLSLGTI